MICLWQKNQQVGSQSKNNLIKIQCIQSDKKYLSISAPYYKIIIINVYVYVQRCSLMSVMGSVFWVFLVWSAMSFLICPGGGAKEEAKGSICWEPAAGRGTCSVETGLPNSAYIWASGWGFYSQSIPVNPADDWWDDTKPRSDLDCPATSSSYSGKPW